MTMIRARWLLVLASAATAANAEIYQCAGRNAMPVYQNFPCEIDTLGSPSMRGTKKTPDPAAMHTTTKNLLGPVRNAPPGIRPPWPPSPAPHVGMTADEVRAIWGSPLDFDREEHAKRDVEVWTYSDSRSVQFDRTGRVIAVHR